MSDNDFKEICKVKDLREREGRRFFVNDTEVAVFKVDGKIYALSNNCPHQHTTLIYDGFIEDGCVVCPAHGWMFDLKTGKMPTGGNGLQSFPVAIINNSVFVKVVRKEWNW